MSKTKNKEKAKSISEAKKSNIDDLIKCISKEPNLISFVGSSRSGKSYMMTYMINELLSKYKFDGCIVFVANIKNYDYYSNFIPKKYVLFWSMLTLCKLLDKIDTLKVKPKLLIVLDDVASQIKWTIPQMKQIIMTYRHYNVTMMFAIQYSYLLPPLVRENSSITLCWKQKAKRSIQSLYDSFGAMFDNIKVFTKFLNENTKEKYQAIAYLSEQTDGFEISDFYRTYIAPAKYKHHIFKF